MKQQPRPCLSALACFFVVLCLGADRRPPGDYGVGSGRPLRFKAVAHLSEDAAVEAWLAAYQVRPQGVDWQSEGVR